jgi:hypothetical protein
MPPGKEYLGSTVNNGRQSEEESDERELAVRPRILLG